MIYKYYTAEIINPMNIVVGGTVRRFYRWRSPTACHKVMVSIMNGQRTNHALINFRRIK